MELAVGWYLLLLLAVVLVMAKFYPCFEHSFALHELVDKSTLIQHPTASLMAPWMVSGSTILALQRSVNKSRTCCLCKRLHPQASTVCITVKYLPNADGWFQHRLLYAVVCKQPCRSQVEILLGVRGSGAQMQCSQVTLCRDCDQATTVPCETDANGELRLGSAQNCARCGRQVDV